MWSWTFSQHGCSVNKLYCQTLSRLCCLLSGECCGTFTFCLQSFNKNLCKCVYACILNVDRLRCIKDLTSDCFCAIPQLSVATLLVCCQLSMSFIGANGSQQCYEGFKCEKDVVWSLGQGGNPVHYHVIGYHEAENGESHPR